MANEKAAVPTAATKILNQAHGKVSGKMSKNVSLVDDVANEVTNKQSSTPILFSVKRANEWIEEAKIRPIPEKLFLELWFMYELCIMFADSNVGKSILAVQIANEIAKIYKVLYFDFELSDKQFENRYSANYTNHFVFPENFLRAEINPDSDHTGFASFEDFLIYSIESVIIETGIKILIIDNITYLKNETDKAKNALPLMKQLKALKKKYDLSILVLAHTPKRDLSKPLTQNDLGGSKMIMNFCDSAFAIGASHTDQAIRYVKQIKERNTPKIYGSENVLVYQIEKPDNFLFMAFTSFSTEREHLRVRSEKEWADLKETVKELGNKGNSQRQIQDKLKAHNIHLSLGAINKYLKCSH